MKKENNNEKAVRTIEWNYTKVSYILDVEEVILPTCDAVRSAGIYEVEDLIKWVLDGKAKGRKGVTKKGLKQLFRVLRNQCGVDAKTLMEAAQHYAA